MADHYNHPCNSYIECVYLYVFACNTIVACTTMIMAMSLMGKISSTMFLIDETSELELMLFTLPDLRNPQLCGVKTII